MFLISEQYVEKNNVFGNGLLKIWRYLFNFVKQFVFPLSKELQGLYFCPPYKLFLHKYFYKYSLSLTFHHALLIA